MKPHHVVYFRIHVIFQVFKKTVAVDHTMKLCLVVFSLISIQSVDVEAKGLPSSLTVLKTLKDKISDLLDLLAHPETLELEKYEVQFF